MIRRPPRSTHCISSAASDVYKRQNKYFKKIFIHYHFFYVSLIHPKENIGFSIPFYQELCQFARTNTFKHILLMFKMISPVPKSTQSWWRNNQWNTCKIQLNNECYSTFHTYCDTLHPFLMAIIAEYMSKLQASTPVIVMLPHV